MKINGAKSLLRKYKSLLMCRRELNKTKNKIDFYLGNQFERRLENNIKYHKNRQYIDKSDLKEMFLNKKVRR